MVKCMKGTVGDPLFKRGDKVGFYITPYGSNEEIFYEGIVEIVDRNGTFEQNEEPSYDVMVEDFMSHNKCLVKHLRESRLYYL